MKSCSKGNKRFIYILIYLFTILKTNYENSRKKAVQLVLYYQRVDGRGWDYCECELYFPFDQVTNND